MMTAVLLTLGLLVSTQPDSQSVFDKMVAKLRAAKTLFGTIERHVDTDTWKEEFAFQKPNRFRLSGPASDMCFDGKTYTFYFSTGNSYTQEKQEGGFEIPVAGLEALEPSWKNTWKLGKLSRTRLQGTDVFAIPLLAARWPNVRQTVYVNVNTSLPVGFDVVTESLGGKSRGLTLFTTLLYNAPLPKDAFVFKVPEGATKMDTGKGGVPEPSVRP